MRIVFYSGLKPPIPRGEFGAKASDSGGETHKNRKDYKMEVSAEFG